MPKQRKKAFSIGTAVAAVSAFALVITSTIAYSLWQNSHSNNIRITQSNTETVEKYKNTVSSASKQLDNHLDTILKVETSGIEAGTISVLNNVFTHYQAPTSENKALEKSGRNQFASVDINQNNPAILNSEHSQNHEQYKQHNLQQTEKKQAISLVPIEKVVKKVNPVDLIIADLKKNTIKTPPPLSQQKKEPVMLAKISKQRAPASKAKPRSQQQYKIRHKVASKPRKVAIKKAVRKAMQIKPRQPAKATKPKRTRIAKAQPVQKRHRKPVKKPISSAIQARRNQPARTKKVSYANKRSIKRNHKVSHNKLALAKRHLENTQKQTIIQQIIANSTAFASHTLRLKKKHKEIGIMNELFIATKSHHYAKQKQLLERREVQLNQKMEKLSQQYSQQLKRLCRYSPPYSTKLSTQATPLERIALRHLKQQLRNCSQSKKSSAKFISKMLRNNYQKLASR